MKQEIYWRIVGGLGAALTLAFAAHRVPYLNPCDRLGRWGWLFLDCW